MEDKGREADAVPALVTNCEVETPTTREDVVQADSHQSPAAEGKPADSTDTTATSSSKPETISYSVEQLLNSRPSNVITATRKIKLVDRLDNPKANHNYVNNFLLTYPRPRARLTNLYRPNFQPGHQGQHSQTLDYQHMPAPPHTMPLPDCCNNGPMQFGVSMPSHMLPRHKQPQSLHTSEHPRAPPHRPQDVNQTDWESRKQLLSALKTVLPNATIRVVQDMPHGPGMVDPMNHGVPCQPMYPAGSPMHRLGSNPPYPPHYCHLDASFI